MVDSCERTYFAENPGIVTSAMIEEDADFAVLDKRLAAMGDLDFGVTTASEFIVYQSQLSPSGSKYTKLHRFPLRQPA